jgi:hypothetical protein
LVVDSFKVVVLALRQDPGQTEVNSFPIVVAKNDKRKMLML